MNRFAHRVVTTKREGDVGDAAGDQRVRQFAFNVFAGTDKILRVVVMLFNTGGDRKDIRVEDNVFRRKTYLFGQDLISAAANLDFTLAGIRLADFIKGHHHHGGTVAAHLFRMLNKRRNALFH